MIAKRGVFFLTIFLILIPFSVWGKFPKPVGYVNDFANILDPEWEGRIDFLIKELEAKTTIEIAAVTVNSLSPYSTIEEYAEALFSEWKIGKAKEDNGILILVSMKEKKIRIETGYGIEPIIPDGVAGEIIREKIAQSFKAGRYGEGLYRGTYAIAERIAKEKGINLEGEYSLRQAKSKGPDIKILSIVVFITFMIVIFVILSTLFPIFLFPFFFILFPKKKGRRSWSSGMFGGGFSGSSGGDFGGFGGGGSGGGGASGDW